MIAPAPADTSVHPKETTAYSALKVTYREHRARFDSEELLRTEQVYSVLDAVEELGRTQRLLDCRTSAWFSVHRESRQVHVLSNACHLRWCPLCSRGRAMHLSEVVGGWVRMATAPKFLTLTIRHSNAPLSHQINELYKSFRKLKSRGLFKKACIGGVWFFQIKFSKSSQQWHPHLHCLIDSSYIPQGDLSELWNKITNGSRIVDIRAVTTPKEAADYVARYAARPTQLHMLPWDQAIECVTAMHGRRICGTWGSARGMSLRPQAIFEKGEYYQVASWTQMQKHAPLSSYARVLFTCWQTGSPLPLCWKILDVAEPIVQPADSYHAGLDPNDRLTLFEQNKRLP